MKTKLAALTLLLLTLTVATAQVPYKIYSQPKLPDRGVLDRLGLTLAWQARLPIHGSRDGIASVRIVPAKGGRTQLFIQTYAGAVTLLDAETGDRLWFTPVGLRYALGQPPALNSHSVFATQRDFLFILDRSNGLQRVWTTARVSKDREFGYHLRAAASAPAAADDEAIYIPVGRRVVTYALPNYERSGKAKEKAKEREPGAPHDADEPLQPIFAWGNIIGDFVRHAPMLAGNQVGFVADDGEFVSLNRFDGKLRLNFKAVGALAALPGQYESMTYFGDNRGTVYALNMESGRLKWRYLAAAPLAYPPAALDADLFFTTGRRGLHRLTRSGGREVWINRDADRFLAANQRFVYALDHFGNLLVLDGRRGGTLAKYCVEDWKIPVVNELTDRIYLAANDGQIICLHYRENRTPRTMKTIELPPEEKKKAGEKKEEKKEKKEDEEKKAEEKAAALRDVGHEPLRVEWRRPAPSAWLRRYKPLAALAPERRGDRAPA